MARCATRADIAADAVVVGAGGAGSAAACALARRGRTVVAIDRFARGHDRGSSHGTERIFRYVYDDPVFIDLALDARTRWRELEAIAGEPLLRMVGGVDFGDPADLDWLAHLLREHDVRCEMLDEAEARRRFTHLHIDGPALFQPDGAVILAADALAAFRTVAGGCGATFVDDDEVTAIRPLAGDAGVVVETASGTMVHASVAIVTTGAWAESVLRGLATLPAITVTCERVGFFRPRQPVANLPTFIDHSPTGPPVYGLATPEGLVKVAEHGTGPIVDPDAREREPDGTRWPVLLDWVAHSLPGVDPEPVGSTTCLYASTADDRFVLDRAGPVVVGVGLGGHGFKFLPSIGERLADLADGVTLDANPFALADPS